ncbi:ABC transporter permease [Metabacillus idriensis]|uniref:ABC transporter permease n=1 Tax=Metabacillus idriensis TaxID=324768 RepID=UPI00174D6079|nr:ABC transporter permease [Metabacillus idriensis]MCM3598740.1 ABC transporter permease [Metabacillus idriensis]
MKSNTGVLLGRLLRNMMRSPDTIITVAITPIMMMLLFVYVFGGAIKTGTDSYVNYLLPGILLITIASGVAYTSLRLYTDVKSGLMARFMTMPIKRSSVLWAHVLTSLISNALSVLAVIFVALLLGFRSGADILGWVAAAGILGLFTLALTWLSVIPGLKASSMEGATAYSYPLIFLPFISSAFVPTETMPKVVRVFAENQPVTSIVNTLRALLYEGSAGNDIWSALAWCLCIMVIASFFASKEFKRKLG